MSDWAKAKTEQMLRRQVELISKSQLPEPGECRGMIELAYAIGLISDTGYGYWQRTLEVAVQDRWTQLRRAKNRKPVLGATA